MADFAIMGRYLRSGSDEYRDMAGYDGEAVWGETGACEGEVCAGREDVEDDWGDLRGCIVVLLLLIRDTECYADARSECALHHRCAYRRGSSKRQFI